MSVFSTYSDEELTEFMRLGDHAAFTEIYDRYNLTLLNHAFNKLRNREEAKDIVQETFTVIWQKRETLEPGKNLPGYLYIVARNLILNHFARVQVKEKYCLSMQQFAAAGGDIPADQRIREKQLEEAIRREVEALPARMKHIFKLSRDAHLNHREIAFRLKVSEQTVSSHITHALKILRTKLNFLLLVFATLLFGTLMLMTFFSEKIFPC